MESMARASRILLVGILVATALVACGESEPEAIAIVGNGTGYSGLPAALDAGVYEMTFNNGADDPDGPLLIEKGGRTPEEFLADFKPVLEGGPFPDYLTTAVGFPTTPPGGASTVTMTLPAGDYIFLSFFSSDRAPVWAEVAVAGESPEVDDLPDSDATVTALDYGFDVSGIEAGAQTVEFSNNGPTQFHHLVAVRFPNGTAPADAEDMLTTLFTLEEGQAPPEGVVEPEDVFDTGVFSPGTGGAFTATFEAGGTYAFLCFIGDRQGGPPHAIGHGMMKAFTVEA